jgi:GntR family transcriptional repressor for pyruvate dehydrogenase complex
MESIFNGIENQKIYQKIVQQIRQLIENGQLKPGDRLPAERELAQLLGCSRASLREAFRVLESEGVLISKHGEGRFVQDIHPLVMSYRFDQVDLLKQSAILSFLEAREALEPKIAELAAVRAREEHILRLQQVIDNMKVALKDKENEVSQDSAFHLAMAEASQNFVFVTIMRTNLTTIRQIRQATLIQVTRYEQSIAEHQAILEAIKKRDGRLAAEMALRHIQNLKASTMAALKDNNTKEEGTP